MLIQLLRFLRGTINFRVEGKYVERFLNLAARSRIPIWSSKREEHMFSGTTLLSNEDALRQIAQKVQLQWTSEASDGAPRIRRKYHKRIGICAGATLLISALILSQQFVWDIEVRGASEVPHCEIIEAAKAQGLQAGVWKHKLDVISIADNLTLTFPEISWAAVNLLGTVAEIEIVERVEPPVLLDEQVPCNVVATVTGRIVELEVYNGQRLVKIGDTIKEGALISAGILQDRHGRTIYRHARARAVVEYTETKTIKIPLQIKEPVATGGIQNTYYIQVGDWTLPLSISSFPLHGEFSPDFGLVESGIFQNSQGAQWFYSVRNHPLCHFNMKLPVTLQVRQYIPAETITMQRDAERGKNLALLKLDEYKRQLKNQDIQIVDTELKGLIQENQFVLIAEVTCRKDATKEIPIQFQENS